MSDELRRWVLAASIVAIACLTDFGFATRNSTRPLLFDRSADAFLHRSLRLEHHAATLLSDVGNPAIFLTMSAVVALTLILIG